MHGLGNDFVVFDAINQQIKLSPEQLNSIADRHFGIGCDQILLVEKAQSDDTEFFYRIYNADGSEVEQCGNGARCFARFVTEKKLTENKTIQVGTASGNITLTVENNNDVIVNMGSPIFTPSHIPFNAQTEALQYTINTNDDEIQLSALSVGNPHAVIIVDNIKAAPVAELGPQIESHDSFPNRVNVGFMSIIDRSHIELRVYERGAGETLACGSGACAAVVAGQRLELLDESVQVSLAGGDLMIKWSGGQSPVWMTGATATVFEGQIEL